MIPTCRVLSGVLVAAAVTGCAGSQPVPSTFEPLTELHEGQRVRVLAPPAERREGEVRAVDPASSVLSVGFAPGEVGNDPAVREVDFSSIQSAWTHRSSVWSGFGWGAAGGALLGGLFGAAASSICDENCTAEYVAVYGLLGAAAGAIVGTVVGAAISGWKHVFEAEADGRGWRPVAEGRPVPPDAATEPAPPEYRGADRLRAHSGWLTGRAGGWLSTWEGYPDAPSSVTQGGALLGASIMADFDWLRVGPEAMYGFLGDQDVLTYGALFEIPILRRGGETYLLAGAGGQEWNSDEPSETTLTYGAFAINGGAGMRFPLGGRTALGGEFRVHYAAFEDDFTSPWLFTLALTFGYGL